MKIAIKEAGKELQILDVSDKYQRSCIKRYTGNSNGVDFVYLSSDGEFTLGVNEDGLFLELPLNFLFESASVHYPIQKIVGTAVFTRCKPVGPFEEIWDYELTDLTEKDLCHIQRTLDPSYQAHLSSKFKDYGKGAAIVHVL